MVFLFQAEGVILYLVLSLGVGELFYRQVYVCVCVCVCVVFCTYLTVSAFVCVWVCVCVVVLNKICLLVC